MLVLEKDNREFLFHFGDMHKKYIEPEIKVSLLALPVKALIADHHYFNINCDDSV